MGVRVIRIVFPLLCAAAGYLLSPLSLAWLIGLLGGIVVVLIETLLQRVPGRELLLGTVGLVVGLSAAKLMADLFLLVPLPVKGDIYVRFSLYILFAYLGIMLALAYVQKIGFFSPFLSGRGSEKQTLLLDSNVIIDGRLMDLSRTGFLDYKLVVPRFVIKELQLIADSGNDMKRERGRRGLNMLNKMRRDPEISVRVEDIDFPEPMAVDTKIMQLAKVMNAKILTNDFNLNQVAELQNIPVLNINNLSAVLKPRFLAGEVIHNLKIIREGKEIGQGVGYLDDGTMIVVENGRPYVGKMVDVSIESTLQTSTGRMIFAQIFKNKSRQ